MSTSPVPGGMVPGDYSNAPADVEPMSKEAIAAEQPKLEISYGRRTFPDDVRAVWGARLIWPNDLIWNRQDLQAHDDDAKQALIAWLNGTEEGNGAIRQMMLVLGSVDARYEKDIHRDNDTEAVLYEDDEGKIVGSAQSSHGYMYVAGWLK